MLVAAVGVVAIVGTWLWAQSLRSQLRDKDVAHANALAAKDTAIVRLTMLGDSQVVAVTRQLAYQAEVELGAAKKAFGKMMRDSVETWATALATLQIRGDSLERELVGRDAEVDTSTGVITAVGELNAADTMGVDVRAKVAIPPTLESPVWQWNVVRSPATVSVGLRCEGTAAAAYLTSPPWLRLSIDSIVQDDRICNPLPSGWRPFEIKVPSVPALVTIVAAGMWLESKLKLFTPDGT
jgi:hypothetical protein